MHHVRLTLPLFLRAYPDKYWGVKHARADGESGTLLNSHRGAPVPGSTFRFARNTGLVPFSTAEGGRSGRMKSSSVEGGIADMYIQDGKWNRAHLQVAERRTPKIDAFRLRGGYLWIGSRGNAENCCRRR